MAHTGTRRLGAETLGLALSEMSLFDSSTRVPIMAFGVSRFLGVVPMAPYKKVAIAASVAVIAKVDRAALLIERRHEPFLGGLAFPGGYMEVDSEDLYQTAVRELSEETGLSLATNQLMLVDVRSSPTRDPRGHTVDVGFMATVESACSIPPTTSETHPRWVCLKLLDSTEFAFDHALFWSHLKARLPNDR